MSSLPSATSQKVPHADASSLEALIERVAGLEAAHLRTETEGLMDDIDQVGTLTSHAANTLSKALSDLSHLVAVQHQLTLDIQEAMTLRIEGDDGHVTMEHFSRSITHTMDNLVENILHTSHASMKLVEEIEDIQSRSLKMEEVLQELSEIAAKTHLLALNASIEAAHARKFGAGFAVVAGEVSSLADRSARLNSAIHGHLSGTRAALEETVTQIHKMATQDLSLFLNSKSQSTSLVTAAETSNERVSLLVVKIEFNAQEVRRRIDDIVRSLQFEDLVRQALALASARISGLLSRAEAWKGAAHSLGQRESPAEVLMTLEQCLIKVNQTAQAKRTVHHDTLEAGGVELF